MDVTVPQVALNSSQFVAFGLVIVPGANLSLANAHRFYVQLAQAAGYHRFHCGLAIYNIEN